MDPKIRERIMRILKSKNISAEILPTDMACTTFNFLMAEGRSVGGALIPPLHIRITDNDVLNTKIKHRKLHKPSDNW